MNIQKILTKEVTRREFLAYLGLFMLTIFGISSLLKNLKSISSLSSTKTTKKLARTLFGSGAYGV
jgi:hypothetical protein